MVTNALTDDGEPVILRKASNDKPPLHDRDSQGAVRYAHLGWKPGRPDRGRSAALGCDGARGPRRIARVHGTRANFAQERSPTDGPCRAFRLVQVTTDEGRSLMATLSLPGKSDHVRSTWEGVDAPSTSATRPGRATSIRSPWLPPRRAKRGSPCESREAIQGDTTELRAIRLARHLRVGPRRPEHRVGRNGRRPCVRALPRRRRPLLGRRHDEGRHRHLVMSRGDHHNGDQRADRRR